ncbi:MAG: UDP-N-acetylmuramate--L-alanine ligase [Bacteroidota bacterium]|nr:UDP-N-acetylmuramate--L-alanine ligase [Bacteroidota bacterium]
MNIEQVKEVYFLGIGGIGMSALARFFKSRGCSVFGYDRTSTPLTVELEAEGMKIHYEEDVDLIPDGVDLVVYTPAIPKKHAEYQFFLENGYPILKRAQVLGLISAEFKTIGIAGTHGKTTISTLTAHLLNQSPKGVNAFLGGISKNFQSNLLLAPESNWIVVEADEFDRSFLHLFPQIAVITAVDADHLDIYKNIPALKESFTQYTGQIKPGGQLIIKKGISLNVYQRPGLKVYTYSIDQKADFGIQNLRIKGAHYIFDLILCDTVIRDVELGLPGLYNVENAIAASAAAWLAGATREEIRKGLLSFSGVNRRFDIRINRNDLVYIDDYAHHPEEIKACINSVKHLYPDKKITGVFQPHLYTRTRDFADDFARSLELLDDIILLEIYPARELPIEGVNSQMLLNKINKSSKRICQKDELIKVLQTLKPELLLTMGAGDIDQFVKPIEEAL